MLQKRTKWTLATAIALAGVGGILAAVAAQVGPPDADNAAKSVSQEIVVDSATLDDYLGFYRLTDHAVLAVTRNGNQLLVQLTGQSVVPVYAKDRTEFFAKVAKAQITFVTDANGKATSLILHQNDQDVPMPRIDEATAGKIAKSTDDKLKSQSATPGSEAALRRLVNGLISGAPNYEEISPSLAKATRDQLAALHPNLERWGAIKSIKFLGVGPQGEDVYTVWQKNGSSHWRIVLDPKGVIATALVAPGP